MARVKRPAGGEEPGVGDRVKVLFAGNEWYQGKVLARGVIPGEWRVHFDDDDNGDIPQGDIIVLKSAAQNSPVPKKARKSDYGSAAKGGSAKGSAKGSGKGAGGAAGRAGASSPQGGVGGVGGSAKSGFASKNPALGSGGRGGGASPVSRMAPLGDKSPRRGGGGGAGKFPVEKGDSVEVKFKEGAGDKWYKGKIAVDRPDAQGQWLVLFAEDGEMHLVDIPSDIVKITSRKKKQAGPKAASKAPSKAAAKAPASRTQLVGEAEPLEGSLLSVIFSDDVHRAGTIESVVRESQETWTLTFRANANARGLGGRAYPAV